MDTLYIEQVTIFGSITRFLDNVKKLGKNNYTPAILKSRLQVLKDYWQECRTLNRQIEVIAKPEHRQTHEYFRNNMFQQTEDVFSLTADYLATWIDKLSNPVAIPNEAHDASNVSTAEQPHFSIQLPRISLPTFSGAYTDWENFKDLFESLVVSNVGLTNVQRLHYLKASLVNDASLILKNVSVIDANYQSAWDLLTKRYDNPRIIINAHLQSFLDTPSLNSNSVKELRCLRDKTSDALTALKNLKRPVDQWDDLIVFLIVQKFDKSTRREWEFRLGDQSTNPTYDELDSFLSARIRALESVAPADSSSNSQNKSQKTKSTKKGDVNSHQSNTTTYTCILCKENHLLFQCKEFKDKTAEQRLEFLKANKRCFNCLTGGYFPSTCYSKNVCKTCKGKHHTLLHSALYKDLGNTSKSTSDKQPEHSKPNGSDSNIETNSHFTKHESCMSVQTTLLPTAFVLLRSDSGRSIKVRALLDQGSQSTFIGESVVNCLRAKRKRLSVAVSGIGGASVGCVRSAAAVTLSSCDSPATSIPVSALILPKLTSYLPEATVIKGSWAHLENLKLADPDPSSSLPIELLIGADLYGLILRNGVRHGPAGSPTAQLTVFGWVISGSTYANSETHSRSLSVHHQITNEPPEVCFGKLWELEEVPTQAIFTEDESQCKIHLVNTHLRLKEGDYLLRLPFKTGPPIPIGESKAIVERIFRRNEKKLHQQLELAHEYREFMEEYERLNHMEKVEASAPSNATTQIVYFPHHPVIKETSQTTRVRVVFNASCSTSNGTSLNDYLHVGPKLLTDLFSLIIRWRMHRYVYTADIEKMFRQIKIHPADVDYQRIVWRSHPADELVSFRLTTLTYGMTCAPFLANRVLKQLAQDEGHNFPLAVPILTNCTYVDDIMFGADDIILAKQTRDQLSQLARAGGFNARRWAGNAEALLDDIPSENHGLATDKLLKQDENVKVLGIAWNPATDSFRFHTQTEQLSEFTKRSFLSMISRIFDPLGWASPFTIVAKITLQIFWIRKIGWDESLPYDLAERCLEYHEQLPRLSQIAIPRWTGQSSEPQNYEIHGFADASNAAYAAVVYLRVESLTQSPQVSILMAKTKVAPIKVQSIPRLELCAAVLLSRLISFVQTTMQLQRVPIYCWSDSSVVLSWLSCHPTKWKTFVANRVSEITTQLSSAQWRHVPSSSNPADCASRGISADDLLTKTLWWQGPPWLRCPPDQWPKSFAPVTQEHVTELRCGTHAHVGDNYANNWNLSYEISSWSRLLRITAYVFRFINKMRKIPCQTEGIALSSEEVENARKFWIKSTQAEAYSQEINDLREKKVVSSKSPLLRLNPFLGKDNLIRLGGRLRHSSLEDAEKFPVILPKHRITDLIIQETHHQTLHGGLQLMLRTLRQQYWVLRARESIKSCIRSCITCARERAAVPTQLMGDLPSVRVTPARPFSHTGVDYAGPLLVKLAPGRGYRTRKSYVALFVCLTTRAIHVELVKDCSTEEFLAAFDRFVSRRGLPSEVYSDNGTNFQGADKELTRQFHIIMNDPDVRNHFATDGVAWHFIPPSAPHFGGIWEAGVKSVKHHLRRVIGSFTPTSDELTTLLCKIECCLNSRPIAPLYDDPDSYDALTPGHFLVGSHLKTVPTPSLLDVNENRLSRWQTVQQLVEHFWKVWSSDYLNSLQQRSKWKVNRANLQVNDLVLLRNPNLPPAKWDLGRIVECHPGTDNLTRVVTIKTAKSTYKRPISQLCKLPVPNN